MGLRVKAWLLTGFSINLALKINNESDSPVNSRVLRVLMDLKRSPKLRLTYGKKGELVESK